MTEHGARQHHRRRQVQHAKARTHDWQKTAYRKQAYDGHESEVA